ncbi:MAG: hypothetical protein MUE44_00885 [Oscillatoriaceae cyanobacterium Prado104]|jgi:hypothetical protein|nr:hypothetical protein [Oscillatoriaceae cyanobacterium Prado104]
MINSQLAVILEMTQTINPQIESDQKFEINWKNFRQLSAGMLVRKVARFLGDRAWEPIDSENWMQRSNDILQVLTGLTGSGEEAIALQAFTNHRVFRPACTILMLIGGLRDRCRFREIIARFKHAPILDRPLD